MISSLKNNKNRVFRLAKAIEKAPHLNLQSNYRKNLEKSFILSIVLLILLFQLFPRYFDEKKEYNEFKMTTLEVIDIPIVKYFEEPPPPVIKIIEPIQIVKIDDKKTKEKSFKEEIKEENLTLDILDDNNELLIVDSQLGDIHNVNFTGRSINLDDINPLTINLKKSQLVMNENAMKLDLSNDFKSNKKSAEKSIRMDTRSLLPPKDTSKPQKQTMKSDNDLEKLIEVKENQFLLKQSESTLGTEEFKTWNRINAALDRLNKDRYGELPNNVDRSSKGISVSFGYEDGKKHDIFWSKGGKVIIRVTGSRPKSQVLELQRAYDSILQLIYQLDLS